MDESCQSCRFWMDADPYEPIPGHPGWCRRNAPVPIPVIREEGIASADSLWPITLWHNWCGEYQPAKEIPAALPDFIEFKFSTRTMNCLHREGIESTEELLEKSGQTLRDIRNFGEGNLEEVRSKLKSFGLKLKDG